MAPNFIDSRYRSKLGYTAQHVIIFEAVHRFIKTTNLIQDFSPNHHVWQCKHAGLEESGVSIDFPRWWPAICVVNRAPVVVYTETGHVRHPEFRIGIQERDLGSDF